MRTHRAFRVAAVAVTLAATSPAVAAAASQDLRSPDAHDAGAAPVATQDLRTPDARDAARDVATASPVSDLRSPDARDAAAGHGTAGAPSVMVVPLSREVTARDEMDWADAGIGAGGALVVVAAGLATALVMGRRRHAVALDRRVASIG